MTLGGLTLDSNGNLSVNKFYKYYGFLILILLTVYDINTIINKFTQHQKVNHEYLFKEAGSLVKYLFPLVGINWNLFKLLTIFHFNWNCIKIAKIIKFQTHCSIHWTYILVFLFWFAQIMTMAIMSVLNGFSRQWTHPVIMTFIFFNIIFALFWSLAAMTWIISKHVLNLLDQINKNLKHLIARPGIINLTLLN